MGDGLEICPWVASRVAQKDQTTHSQILDLPWQRMKFSTSHHRRTISRHSQRLIFLAETKIQESSLQGNQRLREGNYSSLQVVDKGFRNPGHVRSIGWLKGLRQRPAVGSQGGACLSFRITPGRLLEARNGTGCECVVESRPYSHRHIHTRCRFWPRQSRPTSD